jgi:outer membrane protein OmpA-like peptidoglycan-associated protein
LLTCPFAARATDLGFKAEPGVAWPLTEQQSTRFNAGGGIALKGLLGLTPSFDVSASLLFVGLPRSAGSPSSNTGTSWGYGGGVRLKGAHDSDAFLGASPWIDADALYVRTGALNRFGFAAGAGLAFPVGVTRTFWLGPYVRYQQIVGQGGTGIDGSDAKILLAGLSFEFGTGVAPKPAAACPPAVVCPPAAATDRDGDGVADLVDWCPDVYGPASNHGCPVYEKVIVTPDKLELKDKIQFAWDSPRIEQVSLPALDDAVKALQENKSFRVAVEGHASSEGGDEHNQTLSENRAKAVRDYLVSHGVAEDRVTSKGFGSSRPAESNVTEAGREANRRVEFIVHFIILEKGGVR